jgi:hypothetical protein
MTQIRPPTLNEIQRRKTVDSGLSISIGIGIGIGVGTAEASAPIAVAVIVALAASRLVLIQRKHLLVQSQVWQLVSLCR